MRRRIPLESRIRRFQGDIFVSESISHCLNQELLRRDEMRLVERNRYNESELFSISDFMRP